MERDIRDWGGNIAGLVVVLLVNALANSLPLGGQTTGAVAANYGSLLTPASYAFSIWSLIYVAMLAYVVYQALPAQRQNVRLAKISRYWLISCAANVVWVFLWHYEFIILSLLATGGMLLALVAIYRELGIAVAPASTGRKWFVHLPFSIYTGWVAIATLINFSVVQTATGWNDLYFSPETWALLELGVAGAIGATLICRRRDIAATVVIAWAAWAIAIKQVATPVVAGAAQTLTCIVLLLVLFEAVRLYARRSG